MYPHALGLTSNTLDQRDIMQEPKENRRLFIKLLKEISKQTEIELMKVIDAFIGSKDQDQIALRSKILKLVKESEAQ